MTGQVLAGAEAGPLTTDGDCVEIATGAMVPAGTTAILRTEHGTVTGDRISGTPRDKPEWRDTGEEAPAPKTSAVPATKGPKARPHKGEEPGGLEPQPQA